MKKKLNLKTILQFVLSVSVFCLFVWYSSGFFILPQCFNAYFSTCLFSMLSPTLQRKYMFIICNAILALLAISPPFHVQLQAQVSEEALGDFLTIEEAKTQEDYSEQVSAAEHDTEVLIIGEEEGETGYSSEDQLANTDELNRKFEEFIRKMKEEIRIEAQRQPIEV
ncbi:hypothetical protein LR48_Vigan01g326200 [Vigna angularis]|uniref:DUF4408 domain-containing protein n=1 Tax=Phaseolus angularis TaxID=3914 RepID=A0A0L9TT79_PHAAN|nr:uncharacterized protein LOC108330201 [Vigna angularis]KOM33706.1 hypothetical protein LR48_Vigan01g326200 [Vigna angularis]